MIPEETFATRIKTDQTQEIEIARRIRTDAQALHARVSRGAYDDADLSKFWGLAAGAGVSLRVSNPELAKRAGLGSEFFVSVTRDRRRPKLVNFLRALSAIIDVANERLLDVDTTEAIAASVGTGNTGLPPGLTPLVRSLRSLAKDELAALEAERPNDPDAIRRNDRLKGLFSIFVSGFDDLAQAIATADATGNAVALDTVAKTVHRVGEQVNAWFQANRAEAVDWAVRLPSMAAGVALLGWAGANMTIATTVVAAMIGGRKVRELLSKK